MYNPDSQASRILRELLAYPDGVTSMELIERVHTTNPTGRIDELRKRGHDIENVERKDGHTVFKLKGVL